ncbi:hypothetical protein CIHG_02808 [Coccidioides immitis H538.4]|uniref:Uncharacterized protein n=1 Tax=Coccidioides immitis H538.4 TaxID=396776 RepID=A0A0J8RIS8_COCIT|nr:hypothetical protein CIHG_02808 [Coccidioides immitis H538.4]
MNAAFVCESTLQRLSSRGQKHGLRNQQCASPDLGSSAEGARRLGARSKRKLWLGRRGHRISSMSRSVFVSNSATNNVRRTFAKRQPSFCRHSFLAQYLVISLSPN